MHFESLRHVVNPAGGLHYHAQALRYRNSLWTPFREQLHRWLADRPVREPALLIIGASGGYTLESAFLERFREIDIVDPDPLAELIFRRRFPRLSPRWHLANFLTGPRAWDDLDRRFENHAWLFANILGQLDLLNVAPNWSETLREYLARRTFFSYHDVFSVDWPDGFDLPGEFQLAPGAPARDAFIARLPAPGSAQTWKICDHGTNEIFKDCERRGFWWRRKPHYIHFVEAVSGAV